jgi:hypothetical protein
MPGAERRDPLISKLHFPTRERQGDFGGLYARMTGESENTAMMSPFVAQSTAV